MSVSTKTGQVSKKTQIRELRLSCSSLPHTRTARRDAQRMLLLLLFLPLLVASPSAPAILVYSRTAGFRHDSIPTAIERLRTLAPRTNPPFTPTFSEDPALFTTSNLDRFDVILFLSNSDEVLEGTGKAALQAWLQGSGNGTKRGLVGIHSATACLFTTQAFGSAFGAWFDYHPPLQQVVRPPLHSEAIRESATYKFSPVPDVSPSRVPSNNRNVPTSLRDTRRSVPIQI